MQIVAVTDPLELGFARQAMVGVKVTGPLEPVADKIAELDEVDYVVVTAGAYDLLVEVVCESDEHLLELISAGSAPSRAWPRPRRSCTCGCASRPTRGASAEPARRLRPALVLARDRRERLDAAAVAARRPRRRRRRRRRRLHRAVDRLLPRRGRPDAADRGARGRGRGVRRVRPQRRLVLRAVPRLAPLPGRAGRPAPARWPSTGRCARPSTRWPGSPRPRASTPTSPRAAPSRWPATAPSGGGPAPRSATPGRGAAARTTCGCWTPGEATSVLAGDRHRRRDVHPGLRGHPPGAPRPRAGRGRRAARRADLRAHPGRRAIEPGRVRTDARRGPGRRPWSAPPRATPRRCRARPAPWSPVYSLVIATEPLPAETWDADRAGPARDVHRPPAPDHLRAAHRRRPDRLRRPRRAVPLRLPGPAGVRPRRAGLHAAVRRPARPAPRARGHPRHPRLGRRARASPATGAPRSGWTARTGLGWAGGYVGDGVSTTNLAGRTLRDLVLGRDTELTALPWVGHRSPRLGARAAALAGHQRRPARDDARRRRGAADPPAQRGRAGRRPADWATDADELAPWSAARAPASPRGC